MESESIWLWPNARARRVLAMRMMSKATQGRRGCAVLGADESSTKSCATTLDCFTFAISGTGSVLELEQLPIRTVAR